MNFKTYGAERESLATPIERVGRRSEGARELCLKSELNHDKSPLYLGLKRGKGDSLSSKEEKRTEEEKQSCSGDVFISYSQIYGRCNTTQEIMSQRSAQ